jgi:hypothetical protein
MPSAIRNCVQNDVPEELADKIMAEPLPAEDSRGYWYRNENDTKYSWRDLIELGEDRQKNREKYGYADWYDWPLRQLGNQVGRTLRKVCQRM